ncbi:MAG: hypothetical protein Q7T86_07615 [Hyphomicrobiaceae bacterium]|nr:hypothetical protein [Hyphomicrobiaceae bacterium]
METEAVADPVVVAAVAEANPAAVRLLVPAAEEDPAAEAAVARAAVAAGTAAAALVQAPAMLA